MNENTEAELTEVYQRTKQLAVSEDAKIYEAIPIDLRKEQSTKAYKKQRAKILITLTLMRLEQKLIQQNGGQYMK